MDSDDILEHFGVKGMRWGVRNPHATRARNKMINDKREAYGMPPKPPAPSPTFGEARSNRKWTKDITKHYVSVYNDSASAMNNGIQASINGRYKNADLVNDRKAIARYHDETARAMEKQLNSSLKRRAGSMRSPTGQLVAEMRVNRETMLPYIHISESKVKHADEESFSADFELEVDEKGFITKFILPEDLDLLQSDILEHYGIKGMRWGIRRKKKTGPGTGKRDYDAGKLSNQDLDRVIKRMALEKKYNDLNKDGIKKSDPFVQTLLKDSKKQGSKVITGAAIAAATPWVAKRIAEQMAAAKAKQNPAKYAEYMFT